MASRKKNRVASPIKKFSYILILAIILIGGLFYADNIFTPSHTADEHLGLHDAHNIDKTPVGLRPIRDKLIAMLDAKDPNTIFNVVDAIQADSALSVNCHDIAHDIGHKAYELYGFSEAMTFDNPNHVKHALVQYICAGGYMHGILEQLVFDKPEFLERPEIICDQVPESDRASCFHGVGHVFMMYYKRNVPASILGCRVIKEASDTYRCFEGVRMEQFWGNSDGMTTTELGWDLKRPLDSCVAAKEDEKPTCFLYATFGYLRTHVKDYFGAAHLCTNSELPPSDTQFCLKGLGMTMMSKFKGQNMEGSEIYVDGMSIDEKRAFYQGVTGYARLSGVSAEQLRNACLMLKSDVEVCLDALSGYK
ncbi:MAG: hypothetical protein V4526_02480 [Patescibacteria group bacterium]